MPFRCGPPDQSDIKFHAYFASFAEYVRARKGCADCRAINISWVRQNDMQSAPPKPRAAN
ncbi:MAG: hypothetical protein DBX63_03590 [Clostridia bacterium]|nr:MAG: hypothetical protein DBX63_03590 [Clostridia bacterium]